MTLNIFVNGYGISRDIFRDKNYERYLCDVLIFLATNHRGQTTIFLGGGRTNLNFSDRSEAGEMARWFRRFEFDGVELVVMDRTYDAQDNLSELRARIGPLMPVHIFCEYARQDWPRFLAGRLFRKAEVHPVRFDLGKDMGAERRRQRGKLPLKILGWYIPWVREHIGMPQRRKFIAEWSAQTTHRP